MNDCETLRTQERASLSQAFAALGDPMRLALFRLISQAGPDGMSAEQIAQATGDCPTEGAILLVRLIEVGLVERLDQVQPPVFVVAAGRLAEAIELLANAATL